APLTLLQDFPARFPASPVHPIPQTESGYNRVPSRTAVFAEPTFPGSADTLSILYKGKYIFEVGAGFRQVHQVHFFGNPDHPAPVYQTGDADLPAANPAF